MIIRARYRSICRECHDLIGPGTPIQWTKGEPPRHDDCGLARSLAHGKDLPPPAAPVWTMQEYSAKRERMARTA